MFTNREQAGIQLAAALTHYKGRDAVILAVPRGGVPVAYEVAKYLELPMDIILTKKIGHPMNKEYAIGAASMDDYFVITHEDVSQKYITSEVEDIRSKLKASYDKFINNRHQETLYNKIVIVVDDGIATGNTLLATVNLLKKSHPLKIIIATPVASSSGKIKLASVADEVISLLVPEEFYGVGAFYEDFEQVSDTEVICLLNEIQKRKKVPLPFSDNKKVDRGQ
ncbi:MAG: phosphoribosyltransferase [Bacteroidota bacterium]|nr:phosphoribosyltransferase [Bacteroidota bacterium]